MIQVNFLIIPFTFFGYFFSFQLRSSHEFCLKRASNLLELRYDSPEADHSLLYKGDMNFYFLVLIVIIVIYTVKIIIKDAPLHEMIRSHKSRELK